MAKPESSASDRPKGELKSLPLLWAYLRPYRIHLFGMFIALIITSSAVLGMGKGMAYLVDEGFAGNNPALLDQALIVLLIVTAVLAVATYARFYLVTYVGERVIADIRRDVYRHIVHLSPSFFESTKTAEILSRLTSDTALLQVVVGSSLSVALRNTLTFIGGLVLLVLTSLKLTTYVAVILPLVLIPIIVFGRKVRRYSRLSQDKVAELASHAEQGIASIRTVQAYHREEWEAVQFSDQVTSAFRTAVSRVKLRALLTAIVILLIFGSIGIVLWIGGHDVLSGHMTAGALSSFIFYSMVVAGAVGSLSEVVGDMQRAAGATERLFELLNVPSDVQERVTQQLEHFETDITFENVAFCYPSRPDRKALDGINLTITKGEQVAIVGPSGAGKTTLFQLLLRFYDPQQGRVMVDGKDIRSLSLVNLRQSFGYVSQDATIFSTSAYENIRYGRPEAAHEEILEAARAAEAFEFIAALPQGFDTYLGEKGVRLSGGQRQRIAIARAILKNPAILLLDEATSALDAANEVAVQQALQRLMQGRTTLVIAHRLSTVIKADRIIVLNHGVIEAIGTHQELLKLPGIYAELANLQLA